MHLRALCVFCMFATGLNIFAGAATARTPSRQAIFTLEWVQVNFSTNSNLDACTIGRSDTVFVTVAADVSGTELSKLYPSTSAAVNILYGSTAAETDVTVASSGEIQFHRMIIFLIFSSSTIAELLG